VQSYRKAIARRRDRPIKRHVIVISASTMNFIVVIEKTIPFSHLFSLDSHFVQHSFARFCQISFSVFPVYRNDTAIIEYKYFVAVGTHVLHFTRGSSVAFEIIRGPTHAIQVLP
jgi:hypothetical protein